MSQSEESGAQPSVVDRSVFDTIRTIPALRIPSQACSEFMKTFRSVLLNEPKTKNIYHDDDSALHRILLLSPKIDGQESKELPADCKELISKHNAEWTSFPLKTGYEQLTMEEVLKHYLPANTEIPVSFTQVGHIAHFNLRDHQLPFKTLIGQVVLDKHSPRIRTVVNKAGMISNVYRNFQVDVIAGDPNLDTEVKEADCRFRFNFGDVYWNSRLHHEHERIVQSFSPSDVICDVFCGVGPFAIPAAKKGCEVHANDLNPSSHKYLLENIKINKVGKKVTGYNLDGREFIRKIFPLKAEWNLKEPLGKGRPITQVVMNLPALALQFLDAFYGVGHGTTLPPPRIHCHCFTKSTNPKEDILQRASLALGGQIENPEFHEVRDVSPNKLMFCISFELPEGIFRADPNTYPHPAETEKAEASATTPDETSPDAGVKRARLSDE